MSWNWFAININKFHAELIKFHYFLRRDVNKAGIEDN